MAMKLAESKKEIKARIKQLKADGMLPTRYAKAIHTKYPNLTIAGIQDVANGRYYNEEIVDAILELAEKGKVEKQKERLDKLYED